MVRGKSFAVATWILSLGLSFVEGDCFGAFANLFFQHCLVTQVGYNDAYGDYYVSDSGYIHRESREPSAGCALTSEYQVPGYHDLNSIDSYIVVGDSGTIVGEWPDWAAINSPTTQNLWSVCGHDFTYYYAVGDSGTIIKSADGGSTWVLLQSPTAANLYSVECWSDGTVHIYGEGLTAYRSSDEGATWTEMDLYGAPLRNPELFENGPPDLFTSFFVDDSIGLVFGEFGVAFKTTDGGSTWQPGFVPGFNRINTAYFTSMDSGVVAGDNGTIRFTTDGARSWFEDSVASSLTTQNINHIEVSETDSVAVVVGDSGTVIFVATDSTLLEVRDPDTSVPQEYELSQNYPNPFNPRTTIKYSLPLIRGGSGWGQHVSLKVYDLLGREVALLVDDQRAPGTYETTFDGSSLASGIYFYRLQAQPADAAKPPFVETKKLVLVR